jgi:hypothetical protein
MSSDLGSNIKGSRYLFIIAYSIWWSILTGVEGHRYKALVTCELPLKMLSEVLHFVYNPLA